MAGGQIVLKVNNLRGLHVPKKSNFLADYEFWLDATLQLTHLNSIFPRFLLLCHLPLLLRRWVEKLVKKKQFATNLNNIIRQKSRKKSWSNHVGFARESTQPIAHQHLLNSNAPLAAVAAKKNNQVCRALVFFVVGSYLILVVEWDLVRSVGRLRRDFLFNFMKNYLSLLYLFCTAPRRPRCRRENSSSSKLFNVRRGTAVEQNI